MGAKPNRKAAAEFTPVQLDEKEILSLHQMESLAAVVKNFVPGNASPLKALYAEMTSEARVLMQAASDLEDTTGKKLGARHLQTAYSLMNHAMEAAAHILKVDEDVPGRVLYSPASNADAVLLRAEQLAKICEKGATNDEQREQICRVTEVRSGFAKCYGALKAHRELGDSAVKTICATHNAFDLPDKIRQTIKTCVAVARHSSPSSAVQLC